MNYKEDFEKLTSKFMTCTEANKIIKSVQHKIRKGYLKPFYFGSLVLLHVDNVEEVSKMKFTGEERGKPNIKEQKIIECLDQDLSAKEVANLCNCHYSYVYMVKNKYKKGIDNNL